MKTRSPLGHNRNRPAAVILFFTIRSSDQPDTSPNTDELNRQAIVAEGKSLQADMDQANRNHNWSRVREIRECQSSFYRRSDDYLAKHGQTPPPR